MDTLKNPVKTGETLDQYVDRFIESYVATSQPGLSLREQEISARILFYNSMLKIPAPAETLTKCVSVSIALMHNIDAHEISSDYILDLDSLAKETIKHLYICTTPLDTESI